jgi:putative glycosyltransferase (TIGR04372 family)
MTNEIGYEPGITIEFGFGDSKQLADLDKLLNIIDVVLHQNQCDRSVVWNMYQIDRLGHTIFEPQAIHTMYGVDFKDLAILVPGNKSYCNESLFRFAVMGAQIIYTEADWLLRIMHTCRTVVERNGRKYLLIGGYIYEEYSEYLSLGGLPGAYDSTRLDYISNFELDLRKRYKLSENQKIVVLHNREGGWYNAAYHNHRNSRISNFFPAINYLLNQGYVVVRIGDESMIKLQEVEAIIDLPFDPRKNDFDDLVFVKMSSFYIGSTSGPYDIPRWLGKPVLAHNIAELPGSIDNSNLLFKNYYHRKFKRFLTYLEIFTSRAGFVAHMEQFNSLDILPVENTSHELSLAIQEMVRVTESGFSEDDLNYIKHAQKLNKIIGLITSDEDAKFADRIFCQQYLTRSIPSLAYKDLDRGFISLV